MEFLIWIIALVLVSIGAYRSLLLRSKEGVIAKKAENLRFLQIKISLKNAKDSESTDHISNMKQNIEIMNQAVKNLYAIQWKEKNDRKVQNYISLEMIAEKEMIKFIMGVPKDYLETIEKNISSFYAGAVIDYIEQPKILDAGKFYGWGTCTFQKSDAFPLKTYESFEADPMESILSAFSRVDSDEKLCLQMLIAPVDEKEHSAMRKKVEDIKEWKKKQTFRGFISSIFTTLTSGGDKKDEDKKKSSKYSSQQLWDLDKKTEDELFDVHMRALAISPHEHRIDIILNDLSRSLSQYNYVWLNNIKRSRAKGEDRKKFLTSFLLRSFDRNEWILEYGKKALWNIKEITSVYHFPHSKFNKSPRIKWQMYKIVPAPDNLPDEGLYLGHNIYTGIKKEIRVPFKDRLRHFYIIGQTGTGKSSAQVIMAKQDMDMWNGFCVIDPHGELCEDILKFFPKERIDDLIYFDASNFDYPLGFNILTAQNEDERNLITDDLVEMFVQMYGHEIFGPRIQDYFRNAVLALMEQPDGGTLTEIVRMFVDPAFQKIKLKNVTNPVVRTWWEKTYGSMGDREKQEMIPYFQAKFGPFITWWIMRNIIWQPQSSFDVGQAMQEKKIILVNLSKWLLGANNSELIGRMVVTQIQVAAMRRAGMPEHQRVPFYMYIDECQNYVSKSIESVLSEARKYKLGMVLAHQYIDQLKKDGLGWWMDLSKAIFGNVWNWLAYKVWSNDAELLQKEFEPDFSPQDMVNLDNFKSVFKMSVNGQATKAFSLDVPKWFTTPIINTPEKVKIIKQISALKWWRKRELVEKEIFYRVGV
jgi:hypothetical protein